MGCGLVRDLRPELGDEFPADYEAFLEGWDGGAGLEGDDGLSVDGVGEAVCVWADGAEVVELECARRSGEVLHEDLVARL